jgi:branched-chain amino acid transport system ATP-binding protein
MMTKNVLLDVRDLEVSYGKIRAVHRISLQIATGSIVTVIGANGAGKTSSLKALIGLVPSNGRVIFCGEDISALSPERRVDRGISLVPEGRELFNSMNVEDNLRLGAYRFRRDRRHVEEELLRVFERFPRLQERRQQHAGTLSGGERQMLALGRALMSKPRLLMLDEPSLGLAPRIVQRIFRALDDLRAAGMTILLVEQNARAALRLSDFGYVMELGNVVIQGQSKALEEDPAVASAYLGRNQRPIPATAV